MLHIILFVKKRVHIQLPLEEKTSIVFINCVLYTAHTYRVVLTQFCKFLNLLILCFNLHKKDFRYICKELPKHLPLPQNREFVWGHWSARRINKKISQKRKHVRIPPHCLMLFQLNIVLGVLLFFLELAVVASIQPTYAGKQSTYKTGVTPEVRKI